MGDPFSGVHAAFQVNSGLGVTSSAGNVGRHYVAYFVRFANFADANHRIIAGQLIQVIDNLRDNSIMHLTA